MRRPIHPKRTPDRFCSRTLIKGFMHSANSTMLMAQPCRMEHRIEFGPAIFLLIWTERTAMPYVSLVNQWTNRLARNSSLWRTGTGGIYCRTPLENPVTARSGAFESFSPAISSRCLIPPGTPQNGVAWRCSAIRGRRSCTVIRARSL